ncbi:hypothetical protein ACJX0J_008278 [Zea mays]
MYVFEHIRAACGFGHALAVAGYLVDAGKISLQIWLNAAQPEHSTIGRRPLLLNFGDNAMKIQEIFFNKLYWYEWIRNILFSEINLPIFKMILAFGYQRKRFCMGLF